MHISKPVFPESITLEILELSGSYFFFSKCPKFNVHSKNVIKKQENRFIFQDNSNSIGSGKFSVLLREYPCWQSMC